MTEDGDTLYGGDPYKNGGDEDTLCNGGSYIGRDGKPLYNRYPENPSVIGTPIKWEGWGPPVP